MLINYPPADLNFTQSRNILSKFHAIMIKNSDFRITHQNLDFTIYSEETKFSIKIA